MPGLWCPPSVAGGNATRRNVVAVVVCGGLYIFGQCHNDKKAVTVVRLPLCDPGEARTLDPMIKSHLLYQLSYGVISLLISVAKVRTFFELANFFAKKSNFFSRKISGQSQPASATLRNIFEKGLS